MVGMQFKGFSNDPIIPVDENVLKTLSTVDQQRLTKAQTYSSKLLCAPDQLADDETEEKKQEAKRRAVVSQLQRTTAGRRCLGKLMVFPSCLLEGRIGNIRTQQFCDFENF